MLILHLKQDLSSAGAAHFTNINRLTRMKIDNFKHQTMCINRSLGLTDISMSLLGKNKGKVLSPVAAPCWEERLEL